MATLSTRDATVVLTDYNSWTAWYRQFKMKCESLRNWPLVDPEGTEEPKPKPTVPRLPNIADYQPAATVLARSAASSSRTRGNTQPTQQEEIPSATIPTRISELSQSGQEAYKEDRDDYKIHLESYKLFDKEYQEERTKYEKLIEHILATVSPHLQLSCCESGKSVREWMISLQETVGVDTQEERTKAREKYHAALRPMRTPSNWETWLTDYDRAATRAETLEVSEVLQTEDVKNDFLGAVSKVASTWVATFSGPGYDRTTINRKKMMKLFRDHMSLSHPLKGTQKSAFAAGEASYVSNGASVQGTQNGDALSVSERAPSAPSQGGQGKPRQKRKRDGQMTKSKQFPIGNTAAAGDDCLACGQRHNLLDCYYVYTDKAPKWFKPNQSITKLVQYKIDNDNDLQRAIQESSPEAKKPRLSSASRSITPRIKTSQTPDLSTD